MLVGNIKRKQRNNMTEEQTEEVAVAAPNDTNVYKNIFQKTLSDSLQKDIEAVRNAVQEMGEGCLARLVGSLPHQ
jgi:hypothetical protein